MEEIKQLIEKYQIQLDTIKKVIETNTDENDVSGALIARRFIIGFLQDLQTLEKLLLRINGLVQMPKDILIYNGNNEPCDMLIGPCCCGGFHDINWFLLKYKEYILKDYYRTPAKD